MTARVLGDLGQLRRAVALVARRRRQRGLTVRGRIGLLAAAVVTVLVAPAGAALAAEGPVSPFMASFSTPDTHGLSTAQYELSVDAGGWTDPGKGAAAFFATAGWDLYRFWVAVAVWLVNVAMSFEWLELLRPAAEVVAVSLHSVVERVGVVGLLLVLAVVVTGSWMWKGRYGAAAGELAISLVLASLVGGALANPVQVIAGPDTGAIVQAQQLGLETATAIASGGEVTATSNARDAEELRKRTSARMVDVFVRLPHQMINYGRVLDGKDPTCAKAYDEVLRQGPWGDDAAPRDRMRDCNEAYGEAADAPQLALVGVLFIGPGGGLLALFGLVLAVALVLVSALALWEAAKFVVEMVKGIVPGAGRAAMWAAACTIVVCLALIVGLLIFLAAYLLTINGVFDNSRAWSAPQVFIFIDLLLLVAIILLIGWVIKARSSGRRFGQRAARATSPRPAALPSGGGAKQAVAAAGGAWAMSRRMGGAAATSSAAAASRPGSNGAAGGHSGSGPAGNPRGGAGPAAVSGTAAQRVKARVQSTGAGRVAWAAGAATATAGKLALASTVGLPVYGPRWTKQATTALTHRRAALAGKLTAARQRASTSAHAKRQQAAEFGAEYAHNVAAAGRFAGRVSGAAHLAGAVADASVAPGVAAAFAAASTAARPNAPRPTVCAQAPAPAPAPVPESPQPPRPRSGSAEPGSASGSPHPASGAEGSRGQSPAFRPAASPGGRQSAGSLPRVLEPSIPARRPAPAERLRWRLEAAREQRGA